MDFMFCNENHLPMLAPCYLVYLIPGVMLSVWCCYIMDLMFGVLILFLVLWSLCLICLFLSIKLGSSSLLLLNCKILHYNALQLF